MKVWEENKCHSESLLRKTMFRDCPFLTLLAGGIYMQRYLSVLDIFKFYFSTILHTIQSIFYEYSSVVLKNAELYGNLPQEARYRIYLSHPL